MSREPFHPGEVAIQERAGERDRAVLNSRALGTAIPAGARAFVADQRYCVVGWVSPSGPVWASFITAEKGFASTDSTGSSLSLRLPASGAHSQVPPFLELQRGDHLGALFIELRTRRRLRVNGSVTDLTADSIRLQVEEAFPNCPKYIQRREVVRAQSSVDLPPSIVRGEALTTELTDWIHNSDTFFVASAHPDGRVDASHRGGNPGFVRIEGGRLWVPDYPGNSMFGTLGNFTLNPRGGLVFPDFAGNRQLQLTGEVRLELNGGDRGGETGGTGRWWSFLPNGWVVSQLSTALDWTLIDFSPFNPVAA